MSLCLSKSQNVQTVWRDQSLTTYILFHCTYFLLCLGELELVFANLPVCVSCRKKNKQNRRGWQHVRSRLKRSTCPWARSTYSASRWGAGLYRSPSAPRLCRSCPPWSASASPPPSDSSASWSEPTVRPSLLPTSVAWHLQDGERNVVSGDLSPKTLNTLFECGRAACWRLSSLPSCQTKYLLVK